MANNLTPVIVFLEKDTHMFGTVCLFYNTTAMRDVWLNSDRNESDVGIWNMSAVGWVGCHHDDLNHSSYENGRVAYVRYHSAIVSLACHFSVDKPVVILHIEWM